MVIINRFRKIKFWRPVNFVYAKQYEHTGATIMRGSQLAEIAKKYLVGANVSYKSLEHEFKGEVLFLTKGALYCVDTSTLEKFKKNNNYIIFDPIESPLPSFASEFADIVVACSGKALEAYRSKLPKTRTMLLDHHVDPRIQKIKFPSRSELRIGYFGEFANTYITKKIRRQVNFIAVDNLKQDLSWIKKLPEYSMHYAVRVEHKPNRYKPFLKGFTAAHCNANVLVQESEADALRWVGSGYPYLIKGEANETSILKTLEKISDSYGTEMWQDALSIMDRIKAATSEEAISKQLKRIIQEAM